MRLCDTFVWHEYEKSYAEKSGFKWVSINKMYVRTTSKSSSWCNELGTIRECEWWRNSMLTHDI